MHHQQAITRRVTLVLNIDTIEPVTYVDYAARGWLCQLIEQLSQRGVAAAPVRARRG